MFTQSNPLPRFTALCGIAFGLAGLAGAQTLATDSFNRTGTLTGGTPTSDTVTGATWLGRGTTGLFNTGTANGGTLKFSGSGTTFTGTVTYLAVGNGTAAGLDFTNTANDYVFTMNTTFTTFGGDSWAGFGFSTTNTGDQYNTAGVWALYRAAPQAGNVWTTFTSAIAGGVNGTSGIAATGLVNAVKWEIKYNTSSLVWEALFSNNGTLLNTRNLGATPAAINYIQVSGSFGGTGGTNTFTDQNLSFVNLAAIPEPATCAALFGIATLGTALVLRRRS